MKSSIHLVIRVFACLTLFLGTALAQVTLPTPTSPNFDNDGGGGDGEWVTTSNWDTDALPTLSDDAKINNGLTNYYDATVSGAGIEFGTLTIGEGAHFRYRPIGSGDADFTNGAVIYFMNNSQLTFVSGSINSSIDYRIVSGDSATVKLEAGTQNRPRGTLEGAGNLTFLLNGWIQQRWQAANFTGNMTFTSTGGGKTLREFGGWSGSNQLLGQGTNTLADNIYLEYSDSNHMPDNGTLVLVGDGGGAVKLNMNSRVETVANLVIDSPTGTADTIEKDSSGKLTVSDTVTFTGTAGAVRIDDTQTTPAGSALVASNMTFVGTGPWTLQGDGIIEIAGGTVSTAADVTISNTLSAAFTLTGDGVLTLADPDVTGGIVLSNSVLVFATNANFSAGDYVELVGTEASFTADYGGTFNTIGDVSAGIGSTGYFRPNGAAVDNGTSFTVISPPAGTVLLIK